MTRMATPKTNTRQYGQLPYGVEPHEQVGRWLIIGMDADGYTSGEIARQLNLEGIPTRRGFAWPETTVCRLLKRYRQELKDRTRT